MMNPDNPILQKTYQVSFLGMREARSLAQVCAHKTTVPPGKLFEPGVWCRVHGAKLRCAQRDCGHVFVNGDKYRLVILNVVGNQIAENVSALVCDNKVCPKEFTKQLQALASKTFDPRNFVEMSAEQELWHTVSPECRHCGKTCTLRCAGCKSVRYCNDACQKANWALHRNRCKKMRKLAADTRTLFKAEDVQKASKV